jgi:FlaA1/EpsC-like NDP-sugar epimerase
MNRNPFRLYTRANQVLIDSSAFALALIFAFLLRFESWPNGQIQSHMLFWLPILISTRLLLHWALGIYKQVWKFVSLADVVELAKSIGILSGGLFLIRVFYPNQAPYSETLRLPLSIIALEGALSLALSMFARALRRLLYSYGRSRAAKTGLQPKRVLLYGAGRAGIMLQKELETSRAYVVAGFVDDDSQKVGSSINNVQVVGGGESLAELASKYAADEIIISMATASRQTLARTLAKCRRANVQAKIIPSLQEIITGQVQISQVRETRVEDVLGRESVEVLDFEEVASSAYRGARVLVTGAGGSIGSELVRQLVRLNPSSIAILDKDENSIYELEQQLIRRKIKATIEPQIADIRDKARLRAVFRDFSPQIVFHAAAHKHVPLMELHPCEAILNNVGGTQNALDVSIEAGVHSFVFISSDKAVNPVNVMGATKRIGEMLVQDQSRFADMKFACVRFGNVLGSRGSVIPLFQKQIADGGPITVTHPEMMRYFMTIKEAVQLILCAGTLARGGEIFVLDMGKPRNILELAREMILLSGFEPEKDMKTEITGLRPGEKLYEELVRESESLLPTTFEKLSVIEPQRIDESALRSNVAILMDAARAHDSNEIYALLERMELGYRTIPRKAMAASA